MKQSAALSPGEMFLQIRFVPGTYLGAVVKFNVEIKVIPRK